ncbi:hypothetical protein C0J52_06580 [Blattella germanica]|nr:hypothetical protein C0J52_20754 [Blattella germanica]PSN49456.1 hypothetical protein C0J52_06580 [Blattella germanica]
MQSYTVYGACQVQRDKKKKKIAMFTGSEILFVLRLKSFQNQIFITHSLPALKRAFKSAAQQI